MSGLQMPSVLSIQFNESINSTQAEFIVQSAMQDIGLDVSTIRITSVPTVAVSTTDGSSTLEAWVVLDRMKTSYCGLINQFLAMIFKM